MKLYIFLLSLLGFMVSTSDLQAQNKPSSIEEDRLRVMFYNVENLFDPFDDSLTVDEEFTVDGTRHWTWNKFQDKLSKVYKTIVAVGDLYPPAIIGLCEIENRFVLNHLVYQTPFSKFDYRIVHEESPDRRGIDVALLFDPNRFQLLSHEAIGIQFPFDPDSKTRDVLYVKGLLYGTDTVHLFVNHWPSRYGGQMITDPKRKYVADRVRQKCDSLHRILSSPSIIIMGDFNDEPWNESIEKHLISSVDIDNCYLVNLMLYELKGLLKGSHKYQENWSVLDQFIVSKSLLSTHSNIQVCKDKASIFNAVFLLEKDEKYLGLKPYRTFIGFKYHGGFSDHLPIYFDVCK